VDILHVVQGYSPAVGGTEIQIQRVSEELVRQFGDRVTVFTSDCYNAGGFVDPLARRMPAGNQEINGVQVRRFKAFNLAGPVLKPLQWLAFRLGLPFNEYLRVWYSGPHLPGMAAAVRTWQGDVVSAASFPLLHMFTALDAAVKSGKPVIFAGSQHPEDRWGYDRPMIARAIRHANAYIAMTGYEAAHVLKRGAQPDRITVIGNGVDPAEFETCTREDSRERLGLPLDAPVIGFIGQLGRYKGVDTLLQAMPVVWQGAPDTWLLVAGARTSFQPQLQAIVDGMTAEQRGRIVWRLDFPEVEKAGMFSALDVLAYPSGYESFGIAFLEAWAAGKPVIGCQRGAVPWVVEADVDGLLVEWKNAQALARAAITLLANPNAARAMGEQGKMKVLAKYTWPVIARQFREVYARATDEVARLNQRAS
jgi:glycosyltransferase involved in cell wall biosynthesis